MNSIKLATSSCRLAVKEQIWLLRTASAVRLCVYTVSVHLSVHLFAHLLPTIFLGNSGSSMSFNYDCNEHLSSTLIIRT